ncbi:MAG: GTP-sensing pleiotropic transcriptional regulator CodY [Anaerovoracaceae bacterium]|jgi:transcriptional pleiotropic repressor
MSKELLGRIRTLNYMLSESATGYVSFDELCSVLADMLKANVYILNKRGKVLAAHFTEGEYAPLIETEGDEKKYILPENINKKFIQIKETQQNLIGDGIKEIYGEDYSMAWKYHTIVPVIFGGNRVATLLLAHEDVEYNDEDIAICEYGATVVGLEVTKSIAREVEADNRERNAVNMALETLSYSELDAVVKIFGELPGDEGLLVASKVADKYSITRSVIVNALRKLESAGVIESRSLGMKGTRIKITNPFLRDQINKIDI